MNRKSLQSYRWFCRNSLAKAVGPLFPGAAALVLFLGGCSSEDGVRVGVDFSRSPRWEYLFDVEVGGRFVDHDSTRTFSNGAVCRLLGTPRKGEPSALDLRISKVVIKSTILDSGECRNLTHQFENASLEIELDFGTVTVMDSVDVPVVRIGEWDLFRTFVRVVPSLPGRRMKLGETWEREKAIPLATTMGRAIGHLYQTFALDSMGTGVNRDCAYVSWKFTYRIEPLEKDSAGAFSVLPLLGTGTGLAVFNVSHKYLASAKVHFKVPRPHEGLDISWEETVSLRLKDG